MDRITKSDVLLDPINSNMPLLPHATALALLPERGANLLPTPLQPYVIRSQDCGTTAGDSILAGVRNSLAKWDISKKGANERKRTVHGKPFSLALASNQGARQLGGGTSIVPPLKRPGARFINAQISPKILKSLLPMSSSPPGLSWPCGTPADMLKIDYESVCGSELIVVTPREFNRFQRGGDQMKELRVSYGTENNSSQSSIAHRSSWTGCVRQDVTDSNRSGYIQFNNSLII